MVGDEEEDNPGSRCVVHSIISVFVLHVYHPFGTLGHAEKALIELFYSAT
jgi:hypothetical protein